MRVALILATIFSMVDFFTTKWLIGKYGITVEANPLMYSLLETTDSVWVLLLCKIASLVLFAFVLWWYSYKNETMRPVFRVGIWFATIAQCLIAIYGTTLVIAEVYHG